MRSFTLKPPKLTKAEQKRLSRAAYEAVAERSQGVCECCGEARAEAMHHRKYRSRLGEDTVENLLHVCGRSNVDKCHGKAHTVIGEQLGWSALTNNDPAVIPVFHKLTGEWTQDGEPINPVAAMEVLINFGQVKGGVNG